MAAPLGTSSSSTQRDRESDVDWSTYIPVAVDREDSFGPEKVRVTWQKMFQYAGLKSPNEDTQRAFRMAVYVYGCLNGTSREGNYSGQIQMSTGFKFDASVIPRATGKLGIRRFFRGCMAESYTALKKSGVMEGDERFVARAAELGIAAESAFAMADWMADCPFFTPVETEAHRKAFSYSVTRARGARGGNLEHVEEERMKDVLDAQGSGTHGGSMPGQNVF